MTSLLAIGAPGNSGRTDRDVIAEVGALYASAEDDVMGLVGAILTNLAADMKFRREAWAGGYARVASADLVGRGADPDGGRRSALAARLDVHARDFAGLGSALGLLASLEIGHFADSAERFGSATVGDWVKDDAAWRMAVEDVSGEWDWASAEDVFDATF